jgi:hypothetical protein
MAYSASTRNRYRAVSSVVTGAVAAACVAGTGAVMGTASAANAQRTHDKAVAKQRELDSQPILEELSRPAVTVTKIKTVTKPGPGPLVRVIRARGGSSGGGSRTTRKPAKPAASSSGS